MKIFLFILLSLTFSISVFSQEIYKTRQSDKELLFLGAFNNQGFKVYDGTEIQYIAKDELEQIGQLSLKEVFDRFYSEELQITASGYEPFWNLVFKKDSVKGTFIDKEINTPINYHYAKTMGWGWSMMFSSENNGIMGLIRRTFSDCECSYEIEDDTSLYEIFVCIDDNVYEGCLFINKNNH